MQNLARKVDALMRFALAETEQGRAEAAATIRSLLNDTAAQEQDAESIIRGVFLEIGVPDSVLGHRYLVTAISLAVADRTYLDGITKLLYPAVAKHYGTTATRAERAIRHAIELSFDRGDTDALCRYFGSTICGYKGKATNSEFIARIANHVRSQM